MESVKKQTKTERLAASTKVILAIIDEKQALLRSPAASTNISLLAGHRWRLTKAFYNYRWFVKSALGAGVGGVHYDARISAVIVAVDDINAVLRNYVLHWSNGDNASRWPDYQAAASATLDEIAAGVRRLSADAANILHDTARAGAQGANPPVDPAAPATYR